MTQIYNDMQELILVELDTGDRYLAKVQTTGAGTVLQKALLLRKYYSPLMTFVRWVLGYINHTLETVPVTAPYDVDPLPKFIKNKTLVDLGSIAAYEAQANRLSIAVAYYKQVNYTEKL